MKEISRFANPMIPFGGHLYWDIAGLYDEVLKGLKIVADQNIEIDSIRTHIYAYRYYFHFGNNQ